MSTKNTQNTEDMLDQTFANFDSQVTGIEEEVSNKTPIASNSGSKNNLMLFIAAGIAAVGAIAYIVVIKGGMLDGGQPQPQQVAAPPIQQSPAPTADVNVGVPAVPTVPGVTDINQVNGGVPTVPANPSVTDINQVNGGVPTVPNINQVNGSSPTVPGVPSVPNINQVNGGVPTVPGVPSVTYINQVNGSSPIDSQNQNTVKESSASIMMAEELKSMFDRQISEFKTDLTDVSVRVGAIESAVSEQKDINKKVEERLTVLESGIHVNSKKARLERMKKEKQLEQKKSNANSEDNPVVKKKYSKKKVEEKKLSKEENKEESLLVDKSDSLSKKVKENENMPKIEVHSIYGGRAWIKKSDGSLATYEVGDTLSSGEKIRKINDDSFEIITDKRTISK